MNSTVIPAFIRGIVIVGILQLLPSSVTAADFCQQPIGQLVSIQGEAQVQHDGQTDWQAVAMDAKLCPGDMLRIQANGRAAVVFGDETVLRIDQKSTINFRKPSGDNSSILEIFRGVLHIFSHRPRSLKVITPYVNGVVEGTEFLVRVDPATSVITVFEGVVTVANQQGRLQLSSGQSAIAKKDTAPQAMAIVRPRDAVAWTLYYPAIVEPFSRRVTDDRGEPVRLAAADLSIGRVDEARASLAKILASDPGNSEALALSSIIATVGNNKDHALELALRAVKNSPRSASANLALSYAYQALFDIPAALKILQEAAEFTPGNSLVQARLAELYLAVGELDKAQATASKAVSIDSGTALSHTVLGFAYLSRVEIDAALEAFTQTIQLDSASPMARLGLGLAKIRIGRLGEGRADIEIAAALDPDNSLLRSYLGKAYFAEKRDSHAQRQYQIAKKLDPADPTPWFYDAIQKQTINRPVEALHDLQQSIALNDNRAVYRSRLLLDSDLAARSADLGRIYNDLGFQQLARVEGWKSLQSDPADYSAHRFLSDTYSTLPRHEVNQVSELLRSQLLQPINISPVQPQMAESNLAILEGAGPSLASFNEFNPLFLRDRVSLQASGAVGSNDIFGDELVVSGVAGKFSYSIGQFHYQTDGIRDNNDLDQDIYSGFFQGMLSPATSLMTEIRFKERNFGDDTFHFDPDDFSRTLRQSEHTKSVRFGVRHDLNPRSTILGTAVVSADDDAAATGNDGYSLSIDLTSEVVSQMAEVQHIYLAERFNLQSGAGYLNADETFTSEITFPFENYTQEDTDADHTNIYSYAQIDLPHTVQATIGLSGDFLESPTKDRKELNPKLGMTWQPMTTTLIRAAAFKTVTRRFIHAQTIEPTLIAGFNQFFDDTEGVAYWVYGVGADQKFSTDWYGGIEFFRRDMNVPWSETLLSGDFAEKEDDWQEDTGSAYLYWVPANWVTFGLDYYYEHYAYDQFSGTKGIRDLTTHRVMPQVHFFSKNGLSASLQASYINQEGEFPTNFTDYEKGSDQFWVIDCSLSYRLPKRFGIFKLEVNNLFDKQFQFVDTDPAHPQYLPEQQIVGSFTIVF